MQTICCNFIIVTLGTGQINFIDFILARPGVKNMQFCLEYVQIIIIFLQLG